MFPASRTAPSARTHAIRDWLSSALQGLFSLAARSSRRGGEVGFVRASDPTFHFHNVADASMLMRACAHDALYRGRQVSTLVRVWESASMLRAGGAAAEVRNMRGQVRSTLMAATLICSLGKPDAETTSETLSALAELEHNADLAPLRPAIAQLQTLLRDELPAKPYRFSIPPAAHSPRLVASLVASCVSHAGESLQHGATGEAEDFVRAALDYFPARLEHHQDSVRTLLGKIRARAPERSELLTLVNRLEQRLRLS